MEFVKRWAWVGAIAFGLALAASGAFMVSEARQAHRDVRDALAAERIVTPEDAEIPLAPVNSAAAAKAQADVIQKHALAITEGRTYAELERDDPRRATYLQAVTLRTALMESYLAFKVADLVQGIGIIVVMLGASHVVLGAYLALVAAPAKAEAAANSRRVLGSA